MIFPPHPCRMGRHWRGHFRYVASDKSHTISVATNCGYKNAYTIYLPACPSGFETRAQRLASRMNLRMVGARYILSASDANRFVELYAQDFDAILI